MEHGRFDYSPIIDRPPLKLPNDARVAVWVIPNIEHWEWNKPAVPINPTTRDFVPDIINAGWRDYGLRVGVWRMMETFDEYGVTATVSLNSDVCIHYPRIIEEGVKRGWEWMGHGRRNTEFITGFGIDEERAIIQEVHQVITEATGAAPRGWLGPGLTETENTLDVLAETGFEYVGDWTNDDQPYPMRTTSGTIYSIPYSIEVNDVPAFVNRGWGAEEFCKVLCDQFDVLYRDGEKTARVMALCLHPFLMGVPYRDKYLRRALAHITGHDGVWLTTGSEIIDWYKAETGAV